MRKTLVKILSVVLLVVLLACAFCGCGDKSKLEGKWYDKNGDLVLNIKSNGTCELTEYSGTYVVYDKGDEPYIRISLDIDIVAKIYYDFSSSKEMKVSVYLNDSYTGDMTLKKR